MVPTTDFVNHQDILPPRCVLIGASKWVIHTMYRSSGLNPPKTPKLLLECGQRPECHSFPLLTND
eukprot:SAG31_NODE_3369_length_4354_cov_4.327380_4_plen_65_part_00